MDIQHAKQSNTNCNFITKIIVASVSDGAQTLGQVAFTGYSAMVCASWHSASCTLTEYRLVQAHPVVFKEF
jgi:hypothetical protein